MPDGTSRPLLERLAMLRRIPVLCGLLVMVPSALILIGWQFRIPSMRAPFPVGHPITPWGALLFLLLGLSVAMSGACRMDRRCRIIASLCAWFVLLHSVLTIAQYLTGMDFGIDSLFMRSRVEEWWSSPAPRGRYALNAGMAFAGLATAILVRNTRALGAWLSELLALGVGALAMIGLVGYVYGVHALSGLGQKVWMARNGAMLFGTLAVGTFFLHRDQGLARLVTARDVAGVMTRRLLLTSIASFLLLGWLAIDAVQHLLSSVEVAVATLVVATIIVTAVLIFSTAFRIQAFDRARQADSLALQESAERLRVATEAAELGIWIWDTANNQLFASAKAKDLFGVTEQDDWFDYDFALSRVHPEDRERVRRESDYRSVAAEYANEYRVVLADGSIRWLAVRGSRLPSASSKDKVFGVIWDVTDEKLAEEALIRNEKLASVGRMAASIAHEVNNPLAAAMNLLFLSATNPAMPADARQYIVDAQAELNRIAHITRQTLGFYREQALPGKVVVEDVVSQLCDVYRGKAAQNGVAIALRIRRPVGEVFGKAGELRQVVSNLIMNAMDSISGGGTIHVRVVQAGYTVRITVADTGHGIEPRNRSRIFEAFFTTKETTGTGLGLWISRQIVERHNGKIRVRSKVGKGTVFTIVLPTARATKIAVQQALASS